MSSVAVAPVAGQERISAIDLLRGFAVLGILLMNIMDFGLPGAAYMNPTAAGGADGPNFAYWLANQVLFEGKMRFIFSMLFGAGSMLLLQHAEERGAGLYAAEIYIRRTLWLIVFGLVHAYLIWFGDILFFYGVVGLGLLPFRKMSNKGLLLFAGGVLFFSSLAPLTGSFHLEQVRTSALAGDAKAKEQWAEIEKGSKPDPKKTTEEINAHRGGFSSNLAYRAKQVYEIETAFFYRYGMFDVLCAMLIGIALLNMGVLTGERDTRFYLAMLIVGYGIGIPLNAYTGYQWVKSGWGLIGFLRFIQAGLPLGRLSVAFGHIGLLLLFHKLGWFRFLLDRLAAVGQMALTNYLTHSIVCTTIFNGYGLGLFGKLQRYQLLYVVLGLWIFQLIASPIWLRHFRYGPFEWAWRSLTYWHKQPMRRRDEGTSASKGVSEEVCLNTPFLTDSASAGLSPFP